MGKAAAIEFLKEQLTASENDRRKALVIIQEAQARLVQLDAEIQATKLVLAKHGGEKEQLPLPAHTTKYIVPASVSSVSKLVVQALTEAGKPLRTDQLISFLERHGKQTSRATLRSVIHHSAKKGMSLKSISPGLYGLSDWQQLR